MDKLLCAAIGDFDGVHLGHQEVILAAVNNRYGYTPAVYTFETNCKSARVITDNTTKEKLIRELGIEKLIFDDFDKIKNFTPEQFVKDVLIDKYGIGAIVCGADFRFGKNASGDTEILKKLGRKYKIKVKVVNKFEFAGKKLSSSSIREMLENGDMESAAEALGHRYTVTGTVVHGKHLGHQNDAPTVNIDICQNALIPAYGVYITRIEIDGKKYHSVSNIGVRPSIEKSKTPNIETHILDFNQSIYGKQISVEFIKMIRPEIKFKNQQMLFEHINNDIQMAKAYFNGESNV